LEFALRVRARSFQEPADFSRRHIANLRNKQTPANQILKILGDQAKEGGSSRGPASENPHFPHIPKELLDLFPLEEIGKAIVSQAEHPVLARRRTQALKLQERIKGVTCATRFDLEPFHPKLRKTFDRSCPERLKPGLDHTTLERD
jgi:hypothetical protein